jgi:hypothetical protein
MSEKRQTSQGDVIRRDRAWRARTQKSAPQKLQIKLRKRRTRSAILIYNRG